jgi:two-component system, response regulator RegA
MSAEWVRWAHIQPVYELCERNVSETAHRLKMHRRTLQRILGRPE